LRTVSRAILLLVDPRTFGFSLLTSCPPFVDFVG
jgi:hypothetical protein